jgi:hypothetical protein
MRVFEFWYDSALPRKVSLFAVGNNMQWMD